MLKVRCLGQRVRGEVRGKTWTVWTNSGGPFVTYDLSWSLGCETFKRDSECYAFFCHLSVDYLSPSNMYSFISHLSNEICFRLPHITAPMMKKGNFDEKKLIGWNS